MVKTQQCESIGAVRRLGVLRGDRLGQMQQAGVGMERHDDPFSGQLRRAG
jgi:hypothetical protein